MVGTALTACGADAPAAGATTQSADVKAAARTFAEALGHGDAATAKSLCNGGETEGMFIDAITNMVNASREFQETAVARFGDAAKMPPGRNPAQKLLDQIDRSTVKLEGSHATLSSVAGADPIPMIYIEGKWKVAGLANAKDLKLTTPFFVAVAKAAKETTTEVAAGKYATVEDALQALGERRRAAGAASEKPTGTTEH